MKILASQPFNSRLAPATALALEYERRLSARFGVGVIVERTFAAGAWEIAPQVDLDFVEGSRVFVIGVTFGKGF